jgi:hypothetical protein
LALPFKKLSPGDNVVHALRIFPILLLLALPYIEVNADDTEQRNVVIKKVNSDNKQIIFTHNGSGGLRPGSSLSLMTDEGEVCEFQITKIVGNKGVAEIKTCEHLDELKPGTILAVTDLAGANSNPPTPPPIESKKQNSEKVENGSVFYRGVSLLLSYSMATQAEYSVAVNGITINQTDKSTGALGFGFRWDDIPAKGLGATVGLNYEFERSADSYTASGSNGASVSGTYTNKPKVSILSIETNFAFATSKQFYILGGFNYNMPSTSGYGSASILGDYGFQGGLGIRLAPNSGIEALYRTFNFKVSDSVSGTSYNYSYARLWGLLIRGVFFLNGMAD